MKNRKINVDRPHLKAEEVLVGKDFEAVLRSHQMMAKPFYKQTWFFGTTGIATVGLIVGGTLVLQGSSGTSKTIPPDYTTSAAPPMMQSSPENTLIAMADNEVESSEVSEAHVTAEETIIVKPEKFKPIEENFTQNPPLEKPKTIADEQAEIKSQSTDLEKTSQPDPAMDQPLEKKVVIEEEKTSFSRMDMNPRISDKMGGSITRGELMDNRGITTEGDISIIHFEMHLIDGLGGKVFVENGNQLNEEMRDALDKVNKGETIYFENIRGKVKNGTEVRLNPLRYVLLN